MGVSEQVAGGRDLGKVPDTIIGLGGAGKEIVYHFLGTDWVLEQGLHPDGGGDPGFSAFVVDTATSEMEGRAGDLARVEQLNERMLEKATELGADRVNFRKPLEYVNPLENTGEKYTSRTGLTSPATVREIARNTTIRAWWLKNNQKMLTGGYADGVVKRRGLSKALFHAGRMGNDDVGQMINAATGSVHIVVALGGGTGSGMFLDIARRLIESGGVTEVNLLAVLPGMGENDRKRANAFAALSELEYLAATQQNPFKNILLVPYGPAREIEDRERFYEAINYAIVARASFDVKGADIPSVFDEHDPDGPPDYAPFTLVYPQILRYPTGELKQTENRLETFRKAKRDQLEEELKRHESLKSFVVEHDFDVGSDLESAWGGSGSIGTRLDSEQAMDLADRLRALRPFVEDEQFDYLNYEPAERWRGILQNRWEGLEAAMGDDYEEDDFAEQLVLEVPNIVNQGLDEVDGMYQDTKEEELERMIRDELRAIREQALLFKAAREIDDEPTSEAIRGVLDHDVGAIEAKAKPQARQRSLETETRDLADEERLLTAFVEDEEVSRAVDATVHTWVRNVEADVERLVAVDRHGEEIRELLGALERSLGEAANALTRARTAASVPNDPLEFERFDRLNELLDAAGLDGVDSNAVSKAVSQAAEARREYHLGHDLSLLQRLRGKGEEHKRRYGAAVDGVDASLFEVRPPRDQFDRDFECVFVGDGRYTGRYDLADHRRSLVERIVDELRDALADPRVDEDTFEGFVSQRGDEGVDPDLSWGSRSVEDHVSKLRNTLESDLSERSAEGLLDDVTDDGSGYDAEPGAVRQAIETSMLGPVRARLSDIAEERGANETLESRDEALADLAEKYGDHSPIGVDEAFEDVESVEYGAQDHTYLKQTEPTSEKGLKRYDDIADAGLWANGDDQQRIAGSLSTFARKVGMAGPTLPIEHTKLSVVQGGRDGAVVYDNHFVAPVFLSRAFDFEDNPAHSAFQQVEDHIRDQFLLRSDDEGYVSKSMGIGDEWDVAMVTFVTGVFLDNLRPMTQSQGGYTAAYREQGQSLDEDIRIRHAHGVDGVDEVITDGKPNTGGFVFRQRLLDLSNKPESDRDDFIRTAGQSENAVRNVVDMLLGEGENDGYIATETFESTVDLNVE
jgi:hypothetical protein